MSLNAMSHDAIMTLLAPEVKLKMIWALPDAAPAISGYENLVGQATINGAAFTLRRCVGTHLATEKPR
jgi:hypothetical protein